MRGTPTLNRPVMGRLNVLIVDDDDELRNALVSQLALHRDFETTEASNGAAALEAVSGRDVCRLICRKGIHVPVIMLSGMVSDANVILGLDSGANVINPVKMGVLLACRIPYQLDRQSRHNKEGPVQGPALLLTGARPDLFISQHFLRLIHNVIRSINDAIDNILDELAGLRAKQHILIRRFFFEGPAIDSLVKRATQHCNARLGCSRR